MPNRRQTAAKLSLRFSSASATAAMNRTRSSIKQVSFQGTYANLPRRTLERISTCYPCSWSDLVPMSLVRTGMSDQADGPDRAGDDLDRAPRFQNRWSRCALVGDAIHTAAG